MPRGLKIAVSNDAPANLVEYYGLVPEPRHPDAVKLLDYWKACMAKGHGFVVGRDIPARSIASILRSVVVCEPLPDGSDLKLRLAGANVRRRFQGEIKGSLLSQIYPGEDFSHHLSASIDVIRSGKPSTFDTSLKRDGIQELHSEILVLPVTAPDLKAAWVLIGMFYFS